MDGFHSFLKMQEIDKHLANEAQWWKGEGLDPASIAVVMRTVANRIDFPHKTWGEQWDAARPKSARAP